MSFDLFMLSTALVMGLAGSLHCAGMCGPLMLALPFGNGSKKAAFRGMVYHLGRLLTYGAMGAILGSLGYGISIAGWQQSLSLITGILILVMAIFPFIGKKISPTTAIAKWSGSLKQRWAQVLGKKSNASWLILGMLNGLLPCGLVYLALAGALTAHSTIDGVLFMLVFGLGTVPMLAAIVLAKSQLGKLGRNWIPQTLSVLTILIGVLLIVRGLGLGIPYLSPIADSCGALSGCCHQ